MSASNAIVVASAARTAVGSFNGSFANTPAHELGAVVIRELLARAGVEAAEVDEVILGQVLTAAQGQNPARQASIKAGIPKESSAWGLNQVCGSGLRAIALGMQQIATGDARIVIAGGQESMSLSPHAEHLRAGVKMGDYKMIDTMIKDGLWDAFNGYHMGTTAENVARQYQITREDQDKFALASQNKAEAAQKAGRFKDEIVPFTVKGRKGDTVVDQDEQPFKANPEKIPTLKAAFRKDGTVTAANSSSISDGAAALVLMRESTAKRLGLAPLARIAGHSTFAQAPGLFTTAPVGAMRKLFEKTGWSANDVDLYEINEAFAVVTMAAMHEFDLPHEKVNIHGGACALGHPIGASGARILVTLIGALRKTGGKRGVATLCIGGGEAVAMAIEMI